MREVFDPRTESGSERFSSLSCLLTTTFTLLSIFSLVETISLKNLGGTSVLTCEIFTSGFRPWLKNVACSSSLLMNVGAPVYIT